MPIEFRCTHCDKLLRVPDESAGQDAQCPSCGALVRVPASGDMGGAPFGGPPADGWPPAGGMPFGGAPGPDPNAPLNPYQAPTYSAAPPTFRPSGDFRSGPPWERDGASFRSFIETVKLGYSFNLFPDMRREGGWGSPVGFGIVGAMIGTVISMIYQFVVQGLMLGVLGAGARNQGALPEVFGGAIGTMVVGGICAIVLTPIIIFLYILIATAIFHLMLMLFKGDHFPFETTLRVVAYSTGLSYLLLVIPFCGQYIVLVFQIVLVIFGLISAQEISGGKATAAVLLPALVCCGAFIAAVFGMVAFIVQQGGGF